MDMEIIDVDGGNENDPIVVSDDEPSSDARSVEKLATRFSSSESKEDDPLLLKSGPRKLRLLKSPRKSTGRHSNDSPRGNNLKRLLPSSSKPRKKARLESRIELPDVIEIDSDSDSEQLAARKAKKREEEEKQKEEQRRLKQEQDMERNEDEWQDSIFEPRRVSSPEGEPLVDQLNAMDIHETAPKISSAPLRFSHGRLRIVASEPVLPNNGEELYSPPLIFRDSNRRAAWQGAHTRAGQPASLLRNLGMPHYAQNYEPVYAGGSINKIIQHNGRVVACASTVGGSQTGATDAYNKPKTLISWSKNLPDQTVDLEAMVHADRELPALQDGSVPDTSFTMNCAIYEPSSGTLICSSEDRTCWGWTYSKDTDEYEHKPEHYWKFVGNYDVTPHDIALKPGTRILAVAEKRVTIHQDVADIDGGANRALNIVSRLPPAIAPSYIAGTLCWGAGPTADMLFVMTEPIARANAQQGYGGQHSAFDPATGQLHFSFEVGRRSGEEGDAMCLGVGGSCAALVTKRGSHQSTVRLFDVRNKQPQATNQLPLPRSFLPVQDHRHADQVNSMAFSPDELYLALGRNDNSTLVYDIRFFDKVLATYRHEPQRADATLLNKDFYGIVDVQWVQPRCGASGLVTGGEDGCIRLWDPRYAATESTSWILAQVESDVAAFSVGDPYDGEQGLIVGASTGALSVFDIGHR
uniref:WD40 repeat-like protein n=1 Tax=Mycena chlorophos TaxID=658473 RepID=A0ABQ0MCB3_MYCCL|nr:predicted protein [Mycena chlorophos]